MSKALESVAKLVAIRERIALARAKRLSAELAKSKALNQQVLGFAKEYADGAVLAAGKGISVSALIDTLAFRDKLLDGAKQQNTVSENLAAKASEANADAAAARRKNKGFERLMSQKQRERMAKLQNEEWRAVEDDRRFRGKA